MLYITMNDVYMNDLNREKYIDSLLKEIKLLESKVLQVGNENRLSFSFFKESFEITQKIKKILHELEFIQIENMKSQMEKLMTFLSEANSENGQNEKIAVEPKEDNVVEPTTQVEEETLKHVPSEVEVKKDPFSFLKTNKDNSHKEEPLDKNHIPFISINNKERNLSPVVTLPNKSLNDIQQTNITISDSKKNISLNDRFLFQRELFNNNRQEMSEMMLKLQSLNSYEEIEIYVINNTSWNLKDENVIKFLDIYREN